MGSADVNGDAGGGWTCLLQILPYLEGSNSSDAFDLTGAQLVAGQCSGGLAGGAHLFVPFGQRASTFIYSVVNAAGNEARRVFAQPLRG